MNLLCIGALEFLESVYSEDSGLFPFTTRLVDGSYRSVFDHPMTARSTINCLLGLQEAARHAPEHPFLDATERNTERFLRIHEASVSVPADLGLLLLLLSGSELERSSSARVLGRIRAMVTDDRQVRAMNVQDVSWLLWGAVAAAKNGLSDAEPVAHALFTLLSEAYLPPGVALPAHETRRGRFGIVSFGACTYFLRVVHEYGKWCNNSAAVARFRHGVHTILMAQGPTGEWPWLLSNRDGRPLDFYPVFSVHQNSMAMLFLLPALEEGVTQVEPAIVKSMSWLGGKNQLGLSMLRDSPFFIYRSFERKGIAPRAERFLRAVLVNVSKRRAHLVGNEKLVVNRESRSYELGWILYVQSGKSPLSVLDW
jgi:hypothetical protein